MERVFRVLLVDDEACVTDELSLLLGARTDLDLYTSSSALNALAVLKRTRIDLMISDIRVPGMSGLELLRRVRQEQRDCRVVFLTGHADFDYVFEAMRNGASSYILKTESDRELNAQIDKALEEIRKEKQIKRLFHTFFSGNGGESVKAIRVTGEMRLTDLPGIDPARGVHGTLLYCAGKEGGMPRNVQGVIPKYFGEELVGQQLLETQSGALVWLLLWKEEHPLSWHSSVLERLLNVIDDLEGLKLSMVMCAINEADAVLAALLYRVEETFSTLSAVSLEDSFVYTLGDGPAQSVNLCKKLQSYIQEHLKEDLSLTQLGNLTGYNGDYLNRMFRMETGESLGRYIAVCKLERLRSLFQDPQVTIEWAAKQVGFASRSYFNRFIKRETGLSPSAFQASVKQLREEQGGKETRKGG